MSFSKNVSLASVQQLENERLERETIKPIKPRHSEENYGSLPPFVILQVKVQAEL